MYLFLLVSLSGCGLVGDVYQEESRRIINYLLADFPLPNDAQIQKVPTVILGTGTGIAGRIVLESDLSPAENLIFYGNSTQGAGWGLVSSTVAEEIILIYTKEGRHATIEILRKGRGIGGITGGGSGSHDYYFCCTSWCYPRAKSLSCSRYPEKWVGSRDSSKRLGLNTFNCRRFGLQLRSVSLFVKTPYFTLSFALQYKGVQR